MSDTNPLAQLNDLVRIQQELQVHFESLAALSKQNAKFLRNGPAWESMRREATLCEQRALACKMSAELIKSIRREYIAKI